MSASTETKVALDVRLSFDECAALRWSLEQLHDLAECRVVSVPSEHRDFICPALRRAIDALAAAEEWARS